MYFTSAVTGGVSLNVALLESGVVGKQIDGGVTNANYVHKHMLRDMITGQWGEAIDTTQLFKVNVLRKHTLTLYQLQIKMATALSLKIAILQLLLLWLITTMY